MKIIRHGVSPDSVPQQATCNHCNAVIEFVASEVKRIPDQRDGDFYQFDCPCCGKSITKQCRSGYNGPG